MEVIKFWVVYQKDIIGLFNQFFWISFFKEFTLKIGTGPLVCFCMFTAGDGNF